MKLSDVVGAADLAIFAEVALLLFFCAFLAVQVRLWWPGAEATWTKLGRLPLDDEDLAEGAKERSLP